MPASASPAPSRIQGFALVAAGAVCGALLRWGLSLAAGAGLLAASGATLVANLLGSLLLGVLAGQRPIRPRLMLALGVGFCGSLTTFSTWIAELHTLLSGPRPIQAVGLLLVSLAGGLAAAALGFLASRAGGRFRR